tara:strand:- start:239 stop:469 length:231 start_codon:yes stop_codon:yes gene_type:complete
MQTETKKRPTALEMERRRQGFTLALLASKVGTSVSVLSGIESRRALPTFAMQERIATALQLSRDQLFGATPERIDY